MEFKKGDHVYYHSKNHGTIPAVVKAVGIGIRRKKQVLIRGESPTVRGFISSWVMADGVELQEPRPIINKNQKTIEIHELTRLQFLDKPPLIDDNGTRKRWVGIGWIDEGAADGTETRLIR